jgi:hypothetical protein
MVNALIVPVLVTTDLPPDTDLAAFGQLIADAVGTLPPEAAGTPPAPGMVRGPCRRHDAATPCIRVNSDDISLLN